MCVQIFVIPSLPSPLEGPYQVATADDQYESMEALKIFLGLKQDEGTTRNIENEARTASGWDNACL